MHNWWMILVDSCFSLVMLLFHKRVTWLLSDCYVVTFSWMYMKGYELVTDFLFLGGCL